MVFGIAIYLCRRPTLQMAIQPHSKILHGSHIALMCCVWISDQTV